MASFHLIHGLHVGKPGAGVKGQRSLKPLGLPETSG